MERRNICTEHTITIIIACATPAISPRLNTCQTQYSAPVLVEAKQRNEPIKGGASTASTANFSADLFEALCEPKLAKKLKELLVDELRHEVAELRSIIIAKDKQISHLTKQVEALEDKTEELEQYSRRNSLRISGIPEREREDVL